MTIRRISGLLSSARGQSATIPSVARSGYYLVPVGFVQDPPRRAVKSWACAGCALMAIPSGRSFPPCEGGSGLADDSAARDTMFAVRFDAALHRIADQPRDQPAQGYVR